jgi:hypothetical protein
VNRPRAFVLVRHTDVSGVSGTGVVAEGTVWSDGSASVRWPGRRSGPRCRRSGSVAFWPDGVGEVEATHGHDGATEVRYLDHPDAVADVRRTTRAENALCGGYASPVMRIHHTRRIRPAYPPHKADPTGGSDRRGSEPRKANGGRTTVTPKRGRVERGDHGPGGSGSARLELGGDLGGDQLEVGQVGQIEHLQVDPGGSGLGEPADAVHHLGR